MDFKKIMENKPLFYGIIAGIVIVLLLVIIGGVAISMNAKSNKGVVKEKNNKKNRQVPVLHPVTLCPRSRCL